MGIPILLHTVHTAPETEALTPTVVLVDSQEDIPVAAIVGTSIGGLVAVVTLSLLTLAIVCLRVRTQRMKGTSEGYTLHSVPTAHNEAYRVIKGKQQAVTQPAGSSGAESSTHQTTPNVAPSHGYMQLNEASEYPSTPVADEDHNMAISHIACHPAPNEASACPMTSNEAYTISPGQATQEEPQYATAGDGAHQLARDELPLTYHYVQHQ